MQCPLLYRFRVVDRLPQVPSPAAVRGTVVHAVLERLFDLPAGARTLEAARELVVPQWERVRAETPELADLFDGEPGAVAEWLAGAEDLLGRWFELEDPTRLEPADRELYVESPSWTTGWCCAVTSTGSTSPPTGGCGSSTTRQGAPHARPTRPRRCSR